MVCKRISLLVLSLLLLGIIVSTSCGCIETDSSSKQIGTTVLGASVVEHEYLFGLMEPEYDAKIWVLGANVVNVQGVKESELNWYLDQYMKEDTQSTTQSDPVYYQPTSTPVQSKEVVYTNVNPATSGLEVIGDVYGMDTNERGVVDTIRFTVGLSAGGSSMDFSTVQMVFATSDNVEILDPNNPLVSSTPYKGNWAISNGASSNDLVLEACDKFTILVKPSSSLTTNEKFNLEIRPSVGAAFGLKRTIPAKIDKINLLY